MSCTCVCAIPTQTTPTDGPVAFDDGEAQRVYRIVTPSAAYTVGDDVGQVDVAATGVVLTLPCVGKAGRKIIVNAITANVTVTTPIGANMSIVGQISGNYTLNTPRSAMFIRNSNCQWSVIGG
jgi:hypothetical protein